MGDLMNSILGSTVLLSVFVGACGLFLMYIVRLLNADQNDENETNDRVVETEKKKDQSQGGKGKKKGAEARWSGRAEKQGFSHPWLLTSLKGHAGQVLDMDFSSNGKYLASCAEEDSNPPGNQPGDDTSTSSSNQENSRPSSADPSPRTTGLSRRQRKNRRREDIPQPEQKQKQRKQAKPRRHLVAPSRISACHLPSHYFVKLNMIENQIENYLKTYLLSVNLLMSYGFPVESPGRPDRALYFKNPDSVYKRKPDRPKSKFDVNAREFVPYGQINQEWQVNHDSGQGSGYSSESGANRDSTSSCSPPDSRILPQIVYNVEEKKCMRCESAFYIANETEYVTMEQCCYHWGKIQAPYSGAFPEWGCCRGPRESKGCTNAPLHVWSGLNEGLNEPDDFYVQTKPTRASAEGRPCGVYALDCEMCFTVRGLELAKVTVVGVNGCPVYDAFVRPKLKIVDYNSRFSGITKQDMNRRGVKTLRQVQNDLLRFISAGTILVGHGLENDLRALRIVHRNIVDTSVTFPHMRGFPFRRPLKQLVSSFLGRDIQGGQNGHNSFEDAEAAMELMLYKVWTDFGHLQYQPAFRFAYSALPC